MASGRPDYTALALMMGNNAGVLRNVAVDAGGNILTLIKGQSGGNPVTIAVDAAGNILGILQGDYGGVLHTVALDSGGRIVVGQALVSSASVAADLLCPAGVETTLFIVNGSGVCDFCSFLVAAEANSANTVLRVYCDGGVAWTFSPSQANDLGCQANTPGMALTKYSAGGVCALLLTRVFEFKVSFSMRVYSVGSDQHVWGRASYSKIT